MLLRALILVALEGMLPSEASITVMEFRLIENTVDYTSTCSMRNFAKLKNRNFSALYIRGSVQYNNLCHLGLLVKGAGRMGFSL